MMNLLRRRALMIAAQQNTVPVLYGIASTTYNGTVPGIYKIDINTGIETLLNGTVKSYSSICDLGNEKLLVGVTATPSTTGLLFILDLKTLTLTDLTTNVVINSPRGLWHSPLDKKIYMCCSERVLTVDPLTGVVTDCTRDNYGHTILVDDADHYYSDFSGQIKKYLKSTNADRGSIITTNSIQHYGLAWYKNKLLTIPSDFTGTQLMLIDPTTTNSWIRYIFPQFSLGSISYAGNILVVKDDRIFFAYCNVSGTTTYNRIWELDEATLTITARSSTSQNWKGICAPYLS